MEGITGHQRQSGICLLLGGSTGSLEGGRPHPNPEPSQGSSVQWGPESVGCQPRGSVGLSAQASQAGWAGRGHGASLFSHLGSLLTDLTEQHGLSQPSAASSVKPLWVALA